GQWRARPAVHAEEEAEPVFAALAEARPVDRAAKLQGVARQPALFVNLAAKPGYDVFARLQLAAKAVVLAEMSVVRPAVATHEQHLPAIRRQDVAERCQDRGVGHGLALEVASVEVELLLDAGRRAQEAGQMADRAADARRVRKQQWHVRLARPT